MCVQCVPGKKQLYDYSVFVSFFYSPAYIFFAGWTAYRDSCIKWFPTQLNYYNAIYLCALNNAYLVSYENAVKFAFMQAMYAVDYNTLRVTAGHWVSLMSSRSLCSPYHCKNAMNFFSQGQYNLYWP